MFQPSHPLRPGVPLAIAAWLLAASTYVTAPHAAENESAVGTSSTSAESRLKDVEQALKTERSRDEKLAEEAAAFARQNEVLRRELIAAARRAQDIEAELFTLEQELEVLTAQETAESSALANRHKQLAGLLGALERIARFPPEAFVAQRTDPARMVRSAILLRSVVPKIDARASALRDELAILASLSDEIEDERHNLRRTAQDLKLERARLEELLTRKATREERTRSEKHRAEMRAQALAREAEDLRDLVSRLEADRREREEAERKAREQALAEAARRAKQAAETEAELRVRAAVAEAERQMQDVIAAAELEAIWRQAETEAAAVAEREAEISVARATVTLELAPDVAVVVDAAAGEAADRAEEASAAASGPIVVALATEAMETTLPDESAAPSFEPAMQEVAGEDESPPAEAQADADRSALVPAPAETADPQQGGEKQAVSGETLPSEEDAGEADADAGSEQAALAEDDSGADKELALASLPDTSTADDAAAVLVAAPTPDAETETQAQLAFAVPAPPTSPPEKPEPITNARGRLAMPSQGQIVGRYGQRTKAGQTSKGLRIETRPDALVVATYDGRVAFAGPFRGYGQILIIEHGEGYHTLLAGLSEIYGTVGQWLLAGEPIGKMDPAGSANPVLYVELRRRGQPINPLPWLASRSNKVHG